MAHLTVQALRQRVEAAVAALSDFTASPRPWDVFGTDPSARTHRGFAVGTPRGLWTQKGRQKKGVGALVETTLSVRFAYTLRPKGQVASYDLALADEHSIIKAVVGMSRVDVTGLVYVDSPRREVTAEGEWFLGEITFAAQHLIALE